MAKLTKRQWATYRFLREQYLKNPDKYVTKRQIVNNYRQSKDIPDGYRWNSRQGTHDNCVEVTKDLNAIRNCDTIRKIVFFKKGTYKLATKDEFINQYKKQLRTATKIYKSARKDLDRAKLNNQCMLKISKYQNEIVETFRG